MSCVSSACSSSFDNGSSEQLSRASSKSCLKSADSSADSSSVHDSMKRNVSFNSVELHLHAMEIGDNPSASGGVPVTIGWKSQGDVTLDFEAYESTKPSPRNVNGMRLPSQIRKDLILSTGVTMREMKQAVKDNTKIQIQRQNSIDNMKWDKVNYALEKTKRGIKKKVNSLASFQQRTNSGDNLFGLQKQNQRQQQRRGTGQQRGSNNCLNRKAVAASMVSLRTTTSSRSPPRTAGGSSNASWDIKTSNSNNNNKNATWDKPSSTKNPFLNQDANPFLNQDNNVNSKKSATCGDNNLFAHLEHSSNPLLNGGGLKYHLPPPDITAMKGGKRFASLLIKKNTEFNAGVTNKKVVVPSKYDQDESQRSSTSTTSRCSDDVDHEEEEDPLLTSSEQFLLDLSSRV